MAATGRSANRNLETLMGEVGEYGNRTTGTREAAELAERRGSSWGMLWAGLAGITSILALAFSGYSFYATVLKRADLRVYAPPLLYLYRQDFRDVFAIPITISNDGAERGTVLSFDLEVEHLETREKKHFQNLHFGASPRGDIRLFTPVTVQGRSAFTDVVLFHALETGAFFETTGDVKLPLRFTVRMTIDTTGEWFAPRQPAPLVFEMTADYIQSFNDMEAGTPTQLHDARWRAKIN